MNEIPTEGSSTVGHQEIPVGHQPFPLLGEIGTVILAEPYFPVKEKKNPATIYFLRGGGLLMDQVSLLKEEKCYVEPPGPDNVPGLCWSIILIPKHSSGTRT